MIGILQLDRWPEQWIVIRGKKHYVKFVPGSNRKMALLWMKGKKKCMFWFDRSRDCWRTYQEVYAMQRALHHALHGYEQFEIPELTSILQAANKVDAQLVLLPSMSGRDRGVLKRRLGSMITVLDGVQNEDKRKAREQWECVISLRDSLGRSNPLVFRTRNKTALERVLRRAGDAWQIKGHMANYFTVAEHLVWAVNKLVYDARDALDPLVWGGRHRTEATSISGMRAIESAVRDIKQLSLPPFLFMRRAALYDISQAQWSTGENAKRRIRSAWESLEMKAIRITLQKELLRENPELEVATRCFNRLGARRITEVGFRYPGKRDKARSFLTHAIMDWNAGDKKGFRSNLKKAAAEL